LAGLFIESVEESVDPVNVDQIAFDNGCVVDSEKVVLLQGRGKGPGHLEISGAVVNEGLYFSVFGGYVDYTAAADWRVPTVAFVSDVPGATGEDGQQDKGE
jgi:hypothetical protein